MTDFNISTDGVGLNAPGSSGALVATDLVSIDGNAAAHVQYTKIGWGSTGDQFYSVGTSTSVSSTTKPLPVMLRHTDGTALNVNSSGALDVNIASQGSLAISADIMHTLGAIRIEGTAGATPIHVMGSSASEAVLIQATGGTFSATNPQYTLPTMLFGASLGGAGYSAAPVGITGNRLMVNHPDTLTVISDGSGTYVQATGGFTLSRLSALNTTPSVLFGVTHGGGIAPLGVTGQGASGHRLLVDVDGETLGVKLQAIGTADIGGQKTIPTLLYGATGPDAQAIQSTGGRMLVDFAGETVKVDNASNTHLIVLATGGATATTKGEFDNLMPTLLYGVCGNTAAPVGVTNGMLRTSIEAACITLDVTLATTQKVLNATADAGNIHHRYLMVSGVTNNGHKPEESHPVFVTGKDDGSTYSYPIGITTSMVGASGGAWSLMVTGETEVKTWSAGTLTVAASDLDIRGLLGTGAAVDSVEVVGGSGGNPVFIRATGGLGHANIPVHNTMATMIYGITYSGAASGGYSAGAVGITGADMLHVGIGHDVKISASSSDPIFITATGGLSASSGANSTAQLYNTVPSLILGLSGASGAPVGMSGDMLKVYLDDGISAGKDSIHIYPLSGITSQGAGSRVRRETDIIPTLLMGASVGGAGWSAAAIGMSGDAINVNMINAGVTVDVTVGTHVEVSNDYGGPLRIAGACAAGACAGENPYPVSVASNYLGESVFVQGTGGMQAILVHGFSTGNDYGKTPIGVTSGQNWNMASDEALLGISAGVLRDLSTSSATQTVVQANIAAAVVGMAPNNSGATTRIANAANQLVANTHLQGIAGAYGDGATYGMNVNILSFPQPSSFVHGQKLVTDSAAAIHTPRGLSSGVKIKGHQNNQDYIYIGVAGVDHEDGYPLGPSEEIFLEIDDINEVYVYASSNGTACFIGS